MYKTKLFIKVNNERMSKERHTRKLQTLNILIFDNTEFRTKSFKRDSKEKYFSMLKATIHHENLSDKYICTK